MEWALVWVEQQVLGSEQRSGQFQSVLKKKMAHCFEKLILSFDMTVCKQKENEKSLSHDSRLY